MVSEVNDHDLGEIVIMNMKIKWMYIFLLETVKTRLDNGSNEGMLKKNQGQFLNLQHDTMNECCHIQR